MVRLPAPEATAMTTDTVVLFLALLAVTAQGAVLVGLLLRVGAHVRGLGRLRQAGRAVTVDLAPSATAMAAIVALVAMAGSLYLSEVAHFIPCRLCWYQRVAMYPLGPILALAAWRGRRRAHPASIAAFAIVVAAVGAAISTYHVVLERYPTLESSVCDPKNPCTLIWVRRFGYLTIPGMALSGFLLIIMLLLVARSAPQE
jgi:disulfide bond formation protein DsbB